MLRIPWLCNAFWNASEPPTVFSCLSNFTLNDCFSKLGGDQRIPPWHVRFSLALRTAVLERPGKFSWKFSVLIPFGWEVSRYLKALSVAVIANLARLTWGEKGEEKKKAPQPTLRAYVCTDTQTRSIPNFISTAASVYLASLTQKGPPGGVLSAGSGPDWGKVLAPGLCGIHGPLDVLLLGVRGAELNCLFQGITCSHLSFPPGEGKERCPRGKPLSRNSFRLILSPASRVCWQRDMPASAKCDGAAE